MLVNMNSYQNRKLAPDGLARQGLLAAWRVGARRYHRNQSHPVLLCAPRVFSKH